MTSAGGRPGPLGRLLTPEGKGPLAVTPSGHGVSAGIAEWTADEPDLADVVARADAALYEVKARGGRLARRAEVAA
jgi:GGDEF domain-containing protein